MSDLSAAPLEGSLSISDLDKFLRHIRFVLGLGIILSTFHNGRQLKAVTYHTWKTKWKVSFPLKQTCFPRIGMSQSHSTSVFTEGSVNFSLGGAAEVPATTLEVRII